LFRLGGLKHERNNDFWPRFSENETNETNRNINEINDETKRNIFPRQGFPSSETNETSPYKGMFCFAQGAPWGCGCIHWRYPKMTTTIIPANPGFMVVQTLANAIAADGEVEGHSSIPIIAWSITETAMVPVTPEGAFVLKDARDGILYPNGYVRDGEGTTHSSVDGWLRSRTVYQRVIEGWNDEKPRPGSHRALGPRD
jgi:hypothetical protein